MSESPKKLEICIDIDAPLDDVWRALTTSEGLQDWFPPQARVVPGEGGTVFLSWGDGIEGTAPIEIWDVNRRFRWVESMKGPYSGGDAGPLPPDGIFRVGVDWTLEAQGGRTRLRLVHSGFGDGSGWDDDLDSLGRGWQFELRCLKHYLEYHRTRRRTITTITRHPANDPDGTIQRLMGSQQALLSKQEGDHVVWITPAGDRLEGVMLLNASQRQWAVRLPAHDQAVIRLLSEGHGASGVSWSYLSTWGMTDEQRSPLLNLLERWVDDSLS